MPAIVAQPRLVQIEIVHRLDLRRVVGQRSQQIPNALDHVYATFIWKPCENRRCNDVCNAS